MNILSDVHKSKLGFLAMIIKIIPNSKIIKNILDRLKLNFIFIDLRILGENYQKHCIIYDFLIHKFEVSKWNNFEKRQLKFYKFTIYTIIKRVKLSI